MSSEWVLELARDSITNYLWDQTRYASRPPSIEQLPFILEKGYRTAYHGKPGPTYVDLVSRM